MKPSFRTKYYDVNFFHNSTGKQDDFPISFLQINFECVHLLTYLVRGNKCQVSFKRDYDRFTNGYATFQQGKPSGKFWDKRERFDKNRTFISFTEVSETISNTRRQLLNLSQPENKRCFKFIPCIDISRKIFVTSLSFILFNFEGFGECEKVCKRQEIFNFRSIT